MRKCDAGARSVCGGLWIAPFLLISVFICRAQTTAAQLADYHALVVFTDDKDATVAVTVRLAPEAMPERLLIARFADQRVAQLTARSTESAIPFTTTDSAGATIIHLSASERGRPVAPLEIQYSIHSKGRLTRVPLPVVNAPPLPQQRPVTIDLTLPAGTIAIGEGFPGMTWRDPTHGETRLPAVPSVLVVETRTAGSVRWLDRLLTPAALSTAAMFGLLLAGSVVWYTRARWTARRAR